MNKIFKNENGNVYYILYGEKGQRAFLCNMNFDQYVICKVLEDNSWWHGTYFDKIDDAFEYWQNNK